MAEIFFATNRNMVKPATGHFGERFNADGPMFFRVGVANVDKVSNDIDDGYVVRDVTVLPERAGLAADGTLEEKAVGSTKLFAELRSRMLDDKRDVMVLIHGFANTFTDSLHRAAQVRDAYLIEGEPGKKPYEPHMVVFSWPSNGRILPPWEYHDDRQDAAASGVAMARFMMRLIEFLSDKDGRCDRRMHLVTHSMGNWALRHAVQALISLIADARLPTIFTNAFMMAADEDEDTFEHMHKLARLPELARAIHVYHTRGDGALIISDTTKFNPDRVGSGGPRSFSGLSTRIVAVDCSKVDSTVPVHVNHQYYRIRPEVIADVQAVLTGRFLPDQVPGRVTVESGRRYRIESQVPGQA